MPPFLVGGEPLQFPGDPSGSTWNIINCRCTVIALIGDEPLPGEPPRPGETQPVAAFPKDPTSLEVVRHLGGSTGAELVRDPETGALYVRKRGSSPEHLRSECATDAAYQALGVRVPEFQLYETGTGPVKLSAYIPDTTSLTEVMRSGSKSEIRAVLRKLQADFPADALLANWDVVGLDFDNILIDRDKNVWRIDNGSGLLFRAQGGLKPAGALNEWPTELWSMRDPGRNARPMRPLGMQIGQPWRPV
jgi:hypothetical protein